MSADFIDPGLAALDALTGYDAVCVLITADERPLEGAAGFVDWRMGGSLSRVLKSGFFTGSPGEKLLVPTDSKLPVPMLFAVGLGPRKGVTLLGVEHALAATATMLSKAKVGSVAISVSRVSQLDDPALANLIKRALLPAMSGIRVAVFADKSLRSHLG